MTYTLSEKNRQKTDVLMKIAKLIFRKLGIRFTNKYLEEAITRAYLGTLEAKPDVVADPGMPVIADREDASNIAIVLLEALKKYHVKNEVTEGPVLSDESCTLVILEKKEEGQTYVNLLGVIDSEQGDEIHLTLADKTTHSISNSVEGTVENYVVLSKSEYTGEPGYKLNRNTKLIKQFSIISGGIILTATLALAIYNGLANNKLILWVPLLAILFFGIFICYNLFKLEKTNTYINDAVRKFCSNDKKGFNCQQVLRSPGSKLFGLIGLTDIGIIYFCTILAFTLSGLLNNNYNTYLSVLFWCSIIPLPYTLYSVYYQRFVVKKICILCMAILVLLWMQAGYLIAVSSNIAISTIQLQPFIQLLIITAVVSALYYLFMQNRESSIINGRISIENNDYKNNLILFNGPDSQQAKFAETEFSAGGLILGNPQTPYRLTVVLSLFCAPCANKLKELLKLSDWFENGIGITILVKADSQSKEVLKDVLQHTLAGNFKQGILLLIKWYEFLSNERSKVRPAVKQPADNIVDEWRKQNPLIANMPEEIEFVYNMHEQLYKKLIIPHTPFMVYNGKVLSTAYYDMDILKNIIEKIAAHD